MRHRRLVRGSAIAVVLGFAGLAAFQLALAAGAPVGTAAWGGTHRVLPATFRVGSAVAVMIYVVGAFAVLRCAGFDMEWMPARFARVVTWILGVGLPLSALANVASESEWERYLLAPVGLLLGTLCLVVVGYSRTKEEEAAIEPDRDRLAA